MGDIAVQPLTPATLEAELTELVAATYASHEGLIPRVRAFKQAARAAGDVRNVTLARLILADIDNRHGRRVEGVRTAYAIMNSTDDRVVIAHAHAVLAGGLWRLGDNEGAVKHAYEAHRLLDDGDPLSLRVDHANIFAVEVNDQRLGKPSWEEFRMSQGLADRLGHPDLIIANLNNWAWSCYSDGDLATALALTQRMLDTARPVGARLNASCADTVARIFMADGQFDRATRILREALEHSPSTDLDAVPACLITFAEIKLAEGDPAGAIDLLEQCRVSTLRDGVADQDAIALRLLATCHAKLGAFESAYREMVEFLDAWTVRRSEQSEALASVTHARFALDEARRNSEHFRELAERDALTGLWNRRRADDHLASLVAVPAHERTPLSVALLDLDHFKLVNDTFSHAVGDGVLRRLGEILRVVVGPAGRAARYGGEEFVLFIEAEGDEAVVICERLRRAVEAHPWPDLAAGLRVTTSVGVTRLRGTDDPQSVLARADTHLYAAKSAGRNRVEAH